MSFLDMNDLPVTEAEDEAFKKLEGKQDTAKFPEDPIAKGLYDLLTAKQLGMIRAAAREARVDADEECLKVMSCNVLELDRRGASALIDHLKELRDARKSDAA